MRGIPGIGPARLIRVRVGLYRDTRAVDITRAIGKETGVASSTITTGTATVIAIMIAIGAVSAFTSSLKAELRSRDRLNRLPPAGPSAEFQADNVFSLRRIAVAHGPAAANPKLSVIADDIRAKRDFVVYTQLKSGAGHVQDLCSGESFSPGFVGPEDADVPAKWIPILAPRI
jgi:hypothetical protein